jgi:acyl-coenzyme A thioesterase PaaI-like protein
MNPMQKTGLFRLLMNLWPPFLGAGIHVERISQDWRKVLVSLRLRWFNRNYVGTHFGGSLFAMTDPFFMLMLLHNLGKGYLVWDQSSRIEFVKPGRGKVTATFILEEETLAAIIEKTAANDRYLHPFTVDVLDGQGETVARIQKTIYIRRKPNR